MGNLFVSLGKYSPRFERNPKEEFFTQLVGYLLSRDTHLLRKFIFELTGFSFNGDPIVELESIIEGGRVDILIKIDEELLILIENKMGSPISRKIGPCEQIPEEEKIEMSQLDVYFAWLLKQKHKNKFLFLITYPFGAYSSIIENDKSSEIKHFSWREFHRILMDFRNEIKLFSNSEVMTFLVGEAIDFMEEENMGSIKQIRKNDDAALFVMGETFNNLGSLLNELTAEFSKYVKKLSPVKIGEPYFSVYKLGRSANNLFYVDYGICPTFKKLETSFSFFIEIEGNKDKFTNFKKVLENTGFEMDKNVASIAFEFSDGFLSKTGVQQQQELRAFVNDKMKPIQGMLCIHQGGQMRPAE